MDSMPDCPDIFSVNLDALIVSMPGCPDNWLVYLNVLIAGQYTWMS